MTKHGRIFCKKQPPITHPLYLTLHEIFFGGIKKMKIHRLVYTNDEKTKTEVKEKYLRYLLNWRATWYRISFS
jgi:hypothetical protein